MIKVSGRGLGKSGVIKVVDAKTGKITVESHDGAAFPSQLPTNFAILGSEEANKAIYDAHTCKPGASLEEQVAALEKQVGGGVPSTLVRF